MRNIKILSVHLRNFKGFEELNVDFSGSDAVVLGGQNGFGKTTIFDGLELLFTGKIKRLADYSNLHDSRNAVSQDVLPLVHTNNRDDVVRTEAQLQVNGLVVRVFRQANVRDMRNPVDFSAFRDFGLVIDGGDRLLSEEEKEELGLNELAKDYTFLDYLSQEEATAFLKKKEADRASEISKLFNLDAYDIPLAKVNKLLSAVRPSIRESEAEIKNFKSIIDSLQQRNQKKANNVIAYKRICKEDLPWDAENPNLTEEQFNTFLAEDGVMDGLIYYVKNKDFYRQYSLNRYIENVEEQTRLDHIVFWAKYRSKRNELESYNEFVDKLQATANELRLDNLTDFTINIPEIAKEAVKSEVLENFESHRQSLLRIYNSTTTLQRDIERLLHSRDERVSIINAKRGSIVDRTCPLCGHKYESFQELSQKIEEQSNSIKGHLSDTNKTIQQQFDQLLTFLREKIVRPVDDYFKSIGITKVQIDSYNRLRPNLQRIETTLHTLVDRLNIKIDETLSIEEIRLSIMDQLSKLHKDIPENINVQLLQSIYNDYARFIRSECLNENDISAKRNYLVAEHSKKRSKLLEEQRSNLAKEEVKHNKLKELQANLNELKGELTTMRQAYYSKLLNDIRILFYIYSGRIMQTSYFGRGLFIKSDDKCKHIIFTTSGSDDNDVDALYNMSSGQLVSLAVALVLSLNKLYSQSNLLAIDDPIQTIDDINLWGLIETLRHDFRDHFMLLSTHEADYGGLLSYKFRKFGINTRYVDMAKVESQR